MSDLISREALIEVLTPFMEHFCSEYAKDMIIAKIRFMPAVERGDDGTR